MCHEKNDWKVIINNSLEFETTCGSLDSLKQILINLIVILSIPQMAHKFSAAIRTKKDNWRGQRDTAGRIWKKKQLFIQNMSWSKVRYGLKCDMKKKKSVLRNWGIPNMRFSLLCNICLGLLYIIRSHVGCYIKYERIL